jgi:Putative Ig domain
MLNKLFALFSAVSLLIVLCVGCLFFCGIGAIILRPVINPLRFSPDKLPEAKAGVMYDTEVRISRNDTPVGSFKVVSGSLPKGLQLVYKERDTFVTISGVPESPGIYDFTIEVQCLGTQLSGLSASRSYNIIVK